MKNNHIYLENKKGQSLTEFVLVLSLLSSIGFIFYFFSTNNGSENNSLFIIKRAFSNIEKDISEVFPIISGETIP